jgi:NTE family protein
VFNAIVFAGLTATGAATLALAQPAVGPGPSDAAAAGAATTGGARSQAAASRPKIGLALAGGAARGFAHTGVLEWFEANRIPIDFVAGTSMGGLVGGAYATGMSPQEIRALMEVTDWDNMFLADSPFKYKSFRRKEDSREFPSQLKFGLKGGFQMPSGINPGQRILWLLNRIALPYGILDSFDQLPTPFRCVATDIKKGEAVVLDRGNLSNAMRATMAIPLVFTPVEDGDRLYVDGGTLNNIPADVVEAMGADVVIAVDVATDLDGTEKTRITLLGVLGKTLDAMMKPGTRAALKSADLIIDPDLKGLTSLDWRKSAELADRGFAGAKAMEAELLKFRVEESVWQAHQAARAGRRPTATPTLGFVKVTGVDDKQAEVIRGALAAHPGEPVNVDALETSLAYLTGNDRYDTIGYRLEYEGATPGLVVDVVEKSYAPPFLFVAFDLQNIDANTFSADVRLRAVFTDVLNAGSEIRADLGIGSDQFIGGELFVPIGRSLAFATLGRGRTFVAARAAFERESVNGYIDGEWVAEYNVKRTGAGVDLGFTSGRRSELRLGYDVEDVRGRLEIGDPVLPDFEGTNRFASLRFTFDGQTTPLVPTRGAYLQASARRYFDSAQPTTDTIGGRPLEKVDEFWQGEYRYWHFFRTARADRLFFGSGGGTSFGQEPSVNNFTLGGPFRLGSFNRGELRGPNYLLGVGGYLKELFRLPDFLGADVLAGGWVESGSTFERLDQAKFEWSFSGGIIVESLLGPIFGGVSSGSNGGLNFYVSLGPLIR